MLDAIDIGASALAAERTRMNVIANNIANANTTHNAQGKLEPFRRRLAVFEAGQSQDDSSGRGVHVARIVDDAAPARKVHDPHHPDADAQGYRLLPNVNPLVEMVDMITATRAYQANVSVIDMTKSMLGATLAILR